MQSRNDRPVKEMAVITKAKNLMWHCCNMTASTERFPKKYRFSIGVRIENYAIDIYENLIRANECSLSDVSERQERQKYQRQAVVSCKLLNSMIDLARNTKSINISSNSVEYWCGLVVEVKRMAAAWKNNERKQQA